MSDKPYWLQPRTDGKPEHRCLAVLPGEGRCFKQRGHERGRIANGLPPVHYAGDSTAWVEFELAP